MSNASPKVADYPFTTLEPVLGVVEHLSKSFVMVDIPGLLRGLIKELGLGMTSLNISIGLGFYYIW